MAVDWHGKGGVVSEGFEPENLDTSKEFVLELVEMEYLENQTVTFQGDSRQVDRFKTVWMVEGHQTKVWQWFNLPVGFLNGASVNDRANVVLFAKRSGHPVEKGKAFVLDAHFTEHMRIRCYLEKQKEGAFYRMDLNTVIPYNLPPKPIPPSAVKLNGIKGMLQMSPDRDTAWATFQELFGPDEALFSTAWDLLQAEMPENVPEKKAAAPVIVGS